MLNFAAVDGVAAELQAERTSHCSLRKSGIGSQVLASICQAGPKRLANAAGALSGQACVNFACW